MNLLTVIFIISFIMSVFLAISKNSALEVRLGETNSSEGNYFKRLIYLCLGLTFLLSLFMVQILGFLRLLGF